MREIKFRAWDNFNKTMIENNKILKICFIRTEHTPNLIVYSKRNIENRTEIKEQDKNYCNEFELMQYTGLKDKNGKEIYEGDIIKLRENIFKVVWDNECSRFIGLDKGLNFTNNIICSVGTYYKNDKNIVEVIGNIYEN